MSRRSAHPVLRLVSTCSVFGLLAAAAFVGTYRYVEREDPLVAVRVVGTGVDRWVHIDSGEPVAAALLEAHVTQVDGQLLSAQSGRVLDPHHDPATLRVGDRPARLATVLTARQVVRVVDGADTTEGTRTEVIEVAPAPMPDVLRHVQERGVPGKTQRVVGVESGEVVSSKVLLSPIDPRQTTRKVVAFTFDDGPSATWTAVVLAKLKEKGVKATFCEVGQEVDAHPEVSAQVVAGGHQLCNHTVNHDEGMKGAPQSQLDAQIGGGAKVFVDHQLPNPAYFRPPGGLLSPEIKATARALGEQTLYWKVDTEDWRKGADALTISRHLLDQVDPGAIILMHDGGGKDRAATVEALGLAIDYLRARGYAFTFPITKRPAKA